MSEDKEERMCCTFHFAGLNCFIKQDDGSYLVTLPDGRAVKDPRPPYNPIETHVAVMIVLPSDIAGSSRWDNLRFRNDGTVIFDIANTWLDLGEASSDGDRDTQQFEDQIPRWDVVEPGLNIDRHAPLNVLSRMRVAQGLLRARRLPQNDAFIAQLDVTRKTTSGTVAQTLIKDNNQRWLKLNDDAEVVIANVEESRLEDVVIPSTSDDEHFFIYYTLGRIDEPTFSLPRIRPEVRESAATHPFIRNPRGLRVSCSTTLY